MRDYFIDYERNEIRVSRRFMDAAATNIASGEGQLMSQLKSMQMPIVIAGKHKKKAARWTYKQMERYLANVDDSERLLAEFRTAKATKIHAKTWGWFIKNVPNYKNTWTFDSNHRIVTKPVTKDKQAPANTMPENGKIILMPH